MNPRGVPDLERLYRLPDTRAVPVVQRPEIARAVRLAHLLTAPAVEQVVELERLHKLADMRPERKSA